MAEQGQYTVSLLTTSYEEAKKEALTILSKENWVECHMRKKRDSQVWELRYRIPNNNLLK